MGPEWRRPKIQASQVSLEAASVPHGAGPERKRLRSFLTLLERADLSWAPLAKPSNAATRVTSIQPIDREQTRRGFPEMTREGSRAPIEVLKVAGTSKPVSVAGAIAGVLRTQSRVEIHAIGAAAVNQAIKAIAISRGYVAPSGLELVCIPSFIDLTVAGEERTGIRFLVEVR
jgi:stage V sporulation protein S